jgi:hypothetical protein
MLDWLEIYKDMCFWPTRRLQDIGFENGYSWGYADTADTADHSGSGLVVVFLRRGYCTVFTGDQGEPGTCCRMDTFRTYSVSSHAGWVSWRGYQFHAAPVSRSAEPVHP